ncbi:4a-hydroxytetrahydrobiopterin dehydratase [Crenobacter cavernae]|uniref:Putative pterin-4-alpha-carbinolamine dehydratase n=1 Tax=Crenobacter cavernae TaxID=2290923 RepID=A0ABY0FAG1_9NEIS|nr:4a-hydroxytetrahydrobiopterin dehydratase [Crenobacter cavernae]RXZ42626.1 4a-hydroxytetrahydrobiopterin dehydratase [Crenobacter cavernae]
MNLLAMHCETQLGKTGLDAATCQNLLAKLPDWEIKGVELTKTFRFADYYRTIAFVNALAFIANREDHHPDLSVHYNRVVVSFSTHDAGALTLNDFICAAKTEALVAAA